MPDRDLVRGLCMAAIAVIFGLQSLRFPIGRFDRAGPGLFPLLVRMEENFRRALVLSRGSFATFITRPISGTLVALIGIFLVWQMATLAMTVMRLPRA